MFNQKFIRKCIDEAYAGKMSTTDFMEIFQPDRTTPKTMLGRAIADIRVAKELAISDNEVLCDMSGFHCQQAIEKIIMHVLEFNEIDFEFDCGVQMVTRLCPDKKITETLGDLPVILDTWKDIVSERGDNYTSPTEILLTIEIADRILEYVLSNYLTKSPQEIKE